MNPLSAQQVAALAGARLLSGSGQEILSIVSTDTRTLGPGALFVALKGEHFDAHDFLTTAATNGAAALLVSRVPDDLAKTFSGSILLAEDTLTGLQELARNYRRQLALEVVLITGSNGKTSTKDMVTAVLASRFPVSATQGNLNNHIGLPLSVLRADATHRWGVWEIGMNHPGEIAPLAAIAQAKIGIITNIGTAHIGHMGSREAIAQEKGMLAEPLPADGVLILPVEDDFADVLRRRTTARIFDVGFERGQLRATNLAAEGQGTRFRLRHGEQTAEVLLPVPGRHMVSNALLAAAAGLCAGLSLEEAAAALNNVALAPGRLQSLEVRGVRVINDAYNANPDSMHAALTTVSQLPAAGKRFAILGAMGELGEESLLAHQAVGRLAASEGFHFVCSVGQTARDLTAGLSPRHGQEIHHFQDHQEAAAFLVEAAKPGDLVLLKGSRSAALEQVHQLFASHQA